MDGFRFDLATTLAPRPAAVRQASRLPPAVPPGPGARAGEAHRRAVGRRPRRLQGGRVPGAAGRSGTASTATACAASGRATSTWPARWATGSPARPTCTSAAGRKIFASVNFVTATTGSRCATSSPTTRSTTRRTSRTTATAPTTTTPGTAAWRGRRTTPTILALRDRQKRNLMATLLVSQGVPDDHARATSWARRSGATTTPTARTTSSPGSTGASTSRRRDASSASPRA